MKKQTPFNRGHAAPKASFTPPPNGYPKESWWIGRSRSEFQDQVKQEEKRMQTSKFATMGRDE